MHLIQFRANVQALMRRAADYGLPTKKVDEGYVVHSWMTSLWEQDSPRPFVIDKRSGPDVVIQGYSTQDAKQLTKAADMYASPEDYAVLDWSSLKSKELPMQWPKETEIRLTVTVIPTIRYRVIDEKNSRELDAYLHRVRTCEAAGIEVPPREIVYGEWLTQRLAGFTVTHTPELQQHRLAELLRRTQGEHRKSNHICLPLATLSVVGSVVDDVAFSEMIRQGIGRHKAFGYGMVRVNRA